MLAAAGDNAQDPIPVAIETPRGLLVAVLRATGRPIYRDQPAGGGPVSRTHVRVGQEERSRRCDGVGEHPAHRRAPAPDAA